MAVSDTITSIQEGNALLQELIANTNLKNNKTAQNLITKLSPLATIAENLLQVGTNPLNDALALIEAFTVLSPPSQ